MPLFYFCRTQKVNATCGCIDYMWNQDAYVRAYTKGYYRCNKKFDNPLLKVMVCFKKIVRVIIILQIIKANSWAFCSATRKWKKFRSNCFHLSFVQLHMTMGSSPSRYRSPTPNRSMCQKRSFSLSQFQINWTKCLYLSVSSRFL